MIGLSRGCNDILSKEVAGHDVFFIRLMHAGGDFSPVAGQI